MEFWNASHSRRRFVAFGIAGAVPFLTGRRQLFAQSAALGSMRPPRDAVIDQMTREMARIYTAMKKLGPRPEHIHSLGGQVRLMLAHGQAIDLDARVRAGIAQAIDDNGRDALLDADQDDRRVATQLAAFGMDISDRVPRARAPRDKRAAILDGLLVGGIFQPLERLEAAIEAAEAKVDRLGAFGAPGPRGLFVQDCWSSWGVLIDEMSSIAELATWFAPELAIWAWASVVSCEIGMYVSCWGG